MIPPTDFKTSKISTSLSKRKDFTIDFMELKTVTYIRNLYVRLGFKIQDSAVIKFDKYDGTIYEMGRPDLYKALVLSYGDTSFAATIVTICPLKDSLAYEEVKNSFSHIYYDRAMTPDPFEVSNFKIDLTNSPYKFQSYTSGIFSYTKGGKTIERWPNETEPMLNVYVLNADSGMTARSYAQLGKNSLEQQGLRVIEAIFTPTTLIAGNPACELEVTGLQNLKKIKAYILVMIKGNEMIMALGMSPVDLDVTMKEIRDLCKTINFK